MAKRCLHPRLKSFRFKSGEVMTMCPEQAGKFGEGHYDQRTNIEGKLYTQRNAAVQEVEPEPDDFVSDTETEVEEPEIAELTLPTFAALEDESEIVTPELDADNADSGVEEDSQIAMEVE